MASGAAQAQVITEERQGLRENTPRWHALTDVTLVAAPGRVIPQATVVLRDGLITAAGAGVAVPAGARVWSLPGRRVYAGFIDAASGFGVPEALRAAPPGRPMFGPGSELPPAAAPRGEGGTLVARSTAARNTVLRAEQDVAAQLQWRPDEARTLRDLGFTTVLSTPAHGIWRGQGAVVALGAAGAAEVPDPRAQVMRPRATQHLSFEVSARGDGGYPTSLMGAVALARQTLHDARWYRGQMAAAAQRVEPNETLAALGGVLDGRQTVVAAIGDEQDYALVSRLRDEFKLRQIVVRGTGHEYRVATQLAAMKLPVIVPLNFPAPPDVQDPDAALDLPLVTLEHWEQAPSNAARLQAAGVALAFTTAGLRDASREFWPRVRQAIQRGLPVEAAVAALTTQPADWIGEGARLGRVEAGRVANLVITRGDPFTEDDAAVEFVFVDGRPVIGEAAQRGDPRGVWAIEGGGTLRIAGTRAAPRIDGQARCALSSRGTEWQWRLPCGGAEGAGMASAAASPAAGSASVVVAALRGDDRLEGSIQTAGGSWQRWSAVRDPTATQTAATTATQTATQTARSGPPRAETRPPAPTAVYPAGAFGVAAAKRPPLLMVRNATLWTQGAAGRIEGADLLVREGRIAAVGRGLAAPAGAEVIDGTGLHVTPGLIDAHSHIAMRGGINESAHSNSAETRVADALNATDIALYRQLAGGVTASNILHGSANTIGGQSAVIKLRWGEDAAGLVFEAAKPSIKFALGENPRRVNAGGGTARSTRYPATRMGVAQVLEDEFAAAREYAAAWADWRAAPRGRPEPRRDLRLDALVEVLERKRAIHVHSYRADEILMFVRFAERERLEVAAFQHVLEGYKVARAIASIGAGASTFSDWWNFKMEVVDAIPDNAAMLRSAGVVTTLNSDDAELGRRLNTEAAKAMRHGRLTAEEALALVTINAARQLRVDSRTGSLEVGKDADFVLWNGPPLSTYSRVLQTWVDGVRRFDEGTDRQMREQASVARQRLLAAAAAASAAEASRRLAEGGAAGGRSAPGAAAGSNPDAPASGSRIDFGDLAWRRAMMTVRAWQDSYGGHDAWHECTEDGAWMGADQ